MIRVAVDAMGGDRGPEEIVAGALAAATDTVKPILVGPNDLDTQGLELIEAPDVIAMDEKPTEAVRVEAATARSSTPAARSARGRPTRSCRRATPARCSRPACSSFAGSRESGGPRSR